MTDIIQDGRFGLVTFGHIDVRVSYHIASINFRYVIKSISHNNITIEFKDNSLYEVYDSPTVFDWVIEQNGEVIHTSSEESFIITIPYSENILVKYSILTMTGTSYLDRNIFFNVTTTLEALMARTSTAISKEKDGNNYKLLSLDSQEYDVIYTALTNLMKSGYLKYATGKSLEYLCEFWKIYRYDNETDESLKTRLKSKIMLENSNVTPANIKSLISGSFGVSDDDITLLERDASPDYSFATSVNSDYNNYNSVNRAAEFTFFVANGPATNVQMDAFNNMIGEAIAAGVYFNTVKVTLISNFETALHLDDFAVAEIMPTEDIFGWDEMLWGVNNEVLIADQMIAVHTFTEDGTYIVSAYCYGDNFDTDYIIVTSS